jgi:hypothetical protein
MFPKDDAGNHVLTVDFSNIDSIGNASYKLPSLLFKNCLPLTYLKDNYNNPLDLFTIQYKMNDVSFTLLLILRSALESLTNETVKDRISPTEFDRMFGEYADKWSQLAKNYKEEKDNNRR